MMGSRHAASGLLLAAATLPVASQVGADPVLWAAVAIGGAMLPDLDTSGAHAARVWGVPTRLLGGAIGAAAGGHREATHDVVLAPPGAPCPGSVPVE